MDFTPYRWYLRGRAVRVTLPLLFCFILCGIAGSANQNLYGSLSPERYLTGKFDPSKEPLFVLVGSLGIPTDKRKHYLRKEAAYALRELYRAFRSDHPGVPFWIRSATRNWHTQKVIWENKWYGRRLVGGKRLTAIANPIDRALKILEYSSMPGTSRHHWGTDFDINELRNRYYDSGNGAVVYRWMKRNASRFGFCQPYTPGRESGYQEERWHWSYRPLAKFYLGDWKRMMQQNPRWLEQLGPFAGFEDAVKLAPRYVESINAACQ